MSSSFLCWDIRPLKQKLDSFYTRVTRNRLTAIFFLFGFFHCFAQGIIQSFLYSIDAEYSGLLSKIEVAAGITTQNHGRDHSFLEGSSGNYRLVLCDWIPHNSTDCHDVFNSTISDSAPDLTANASSLRGEILRGTFSAFANFNTAHNVSSVVIVSQNTSQPNVTISEECAQILTFPTQDLNNNKREDLAFVFLQFWLFMISVLAMIYDSVPHVVAGVIARVLLTAWSCYAIWRTKSKEDIYWQLIGEPGTPCSIDLFPLYFKIRTQYEIPDIVLNLTALYIACHLSFTLFKEYSARSFKPLGAPLKLFRMYKFYLAVQVCLQLEVYVLIAGMSLWVDQLLNTYIGKISQHTYIYVGVFVFFTVLVVPWLLTGWYAIRYEKRWWMYIFIFTAFFFFFTASIMFYADTYRWTFTNWANLACFTVASMMLMAASFFLGIICLRNFGKGLSQYLHAESMLEAINFSPEVFEHDTTKHHIVLKTDPEPKKLRKAYSGDSENGSSYGLVMDDWIRH